MTFAVLLVPRAWALRLGTPVPIVKHPQCGLKRATSRRFLGVLPIALAPGVAEMQWQLSRHDQHHVEANRQAREVGSARKEMRRRPHDAVALARRNRLAGTRMIAARLHLDRYQRAAAARQDIDLAHRHPVVA